MAKLPLTKTYCPRDIGAALNNCLLAASQPDDFVIRESRLRRLSEYAAAVVKPCSQHLEQFKENGDPLICHQELVVALISAAILVHAAHYTGADKLPMMSLAKIIHNKEK